MKIFNIVCAIIGTLISVYLFFVGDIFFILTWIINSFFIVLATFDVYDYYIKKYNIEYMKGDDN